MDEERGIEFGELPGFSREARNSKLQTPSKLKGQNPKPKAGYEGPTLAKAGGWKQPKSQQLSAAAMSNQLSGEERSRTCCK